MLLMTAWFGTFGCDKDGKVVKHKLFPKDPKAIAERLQRIELGEILPEEKELVQSTGWKTFSVYESRLEALGGKLVEEREIDLQEYEYDNKLLHDAMIELSKTKLKEKTKEDEHITHAINSLDEQAHAFNTLFEHLKEWYALHFPELEKIVTKKEFLTLISEKGDRESMNLINESIGIDISEEEKEIFQSFSALLQESENSMTNLKKYLECKMKSVAPNLNYIAGPLIGARLISYAGSLKRLARMPSSTIQLLGAEKALFKHLMDGSKPPKHGIIFQHAMVHKAPHSVRGKVARTFASKISIAARADFYSKNFIAEELKISLDKAMASITSRQKL